MSSAESLYQKDLLAYGVLRFAEVFERSLDRAGYKQLTFAAKVGTSQSFLSQIIAGKRTPPLDQIEAWANVLELHGENRAEFIRLAYLAHCPGPIAEEHLRLRARVDKLERRVAEYEDKYKA